MNLLAIMVNIFFPWLTFCSIFAGMSFSLHYQRPVVSWLLVALGVLASATSGFLAWKTAEREREDMWYTFAALALLLATILAAVFGDFNFWVNMQPYYDIENLNTYPSVDPARERGQQLMDSGRVYFADNVALDMRKTMGFKNLDVYCVAPIVSKPWKGEPPMDTYDFWAVGTNCCSGVSSDFRCGEFNNKNARAGLRLMREDQRPFFRLAVQQAEAAYNIKAPHPIFYYWMQDPVEETNAYKNDGFKYFLLGMFTHFAFNCFCVVCALFAFSKLGRY